MAMTQMGLFILGALATLSSVGMLREISDALTNLVIALASAVVWALFAYGALDVIVRDSYAATASEPMYPLVYVGVAFAGISLLVVLDRFATVLSGSAGATTQEGLIE